MHYRLAFPVMVVLALWVGLTTVRVELQNAAANHYLPRVDSEPGKWRVSRERTPRDELRSMIQNIGLLQYILAPLLLGISVVYLASSKGAFRKAIPISCCLIGLVALAFALYRGYYTNLGL